MASGSEKWKWYNKQRAMNKGSSPAGRREESTPKKAQSPALFKSNNTESRKKKAALKKSRQASNPALRGFRQRTSTPFD